jgi:predicted phosphodiesterase
VTVRIGLVSDLHLEFYRDDGEALLLSLEPTDVDVLVVAGDLAGPPQLQRGLRTLCSRFRQVVYVFGNHEYYGSSFSDLRQEVAWSVWDLENLHLLDNRAVELGGQRFVGTTLWFTPGAGDDLFAHMMSDFDAIERFADEVGEENRRALDFLRATVRTNDIVVTHHLPSWRCVVPKFSGSVLNRFFVCDQEPLILERQPAIWAFGHTHEPSDLRIGVTRVVCNPLGYPGEHFGRPPRVVVLEIP